MSNIGDALKTKLLSYSTVSAIVGQRMYPDVLVQNATLPAILYYVEATERFHAVDGLTKAASATFKVELYGVSRVALSQLSKAIRETGIDSFRGVVNSYTFCGIMFTSGDVYHSVTPLTGSQEHIYVCSFSLTVNYKEP
jgi:hypothetical protein